MSATTIKLLLYLSELGATGFFVLSFAFISWTKVALGAALVVVGAFFPHSTSDKASGSGAIKIAGIFITLRGSLRVGVVIAGLALIVDEGIEANERIQNYHAAAKEMSGPRDGDDGSVASLSSASRIEMLTKWQATLMHVQSVKPDPDVAKMLAYVERQLQLERIEEHRKKSTEPSANKHETDAAP